MFIPIIIAIAFLSLINAAETQPASTIQVRRTFILEGTLYQLFWKHEPVTSPLSHESHFDWDTKANVKNGEGEALEPCALEEGAYRIQRHGDRFRYLGERNGKLKLRYLSQIEWTVKKAKFTDRSHPDLSILQFETNSQFMGSTVRNGLLTINREMQPSFDFSYRAVLSDYAQNLVPWCTKDDKRVYLQVYASNMWLSLDASPRIGEPSGEIEYKVNTAPETAFSFEFQGHHDK